MKIYVYDNKSGLEVIRDLDIYPLYRCEYCKYYSDNYEHGFWCKRPKEEGKIYSLIHDSAHLPNDKPCYEERGLTGKCGPEGKFFERR